MADGAAIIIDIDENDFIYADNLLFRAFDTDMTFNRDRRAPNGNSLYANLDDITLDGGSEEIESGHGFGDKGLCLHLTGGIDTAFFINPFQKPSTEKRVTGIQIAGFDDFARAVFAFMLAKHSFDMPNS